MCIIIIIFATNYFYQMEARIQASKTRQFKAIFPDSLNANNTLFGGLAMQWMDEVAYITATRLSRQRLFTVKVDKIKFLKPIKPDSIIEIIGTVEKAGAVRIQVKVEIFSEKMYGNKREKAIEGNFVFAQFNDDQKPTRIDY